MNKYVIMGVQGCGKGTQAKALCDKFDWIHICVGDILRWNIQHHTKVAAQVNKILSEGNLAPDNIVEEIVSHRLAMHDWNYGFVLDGFPRNTAQSEFFLESYDIDAVIHIDVSDDVVYKRVLSRRLCGNCGLDYNLIDHRPKVSDVCDVCQNPLVTREDDNEIAIRKRLQEYREKTEPVLELFRKKELVIDIDGTNEAKAIFSDIVDSLK